MLPPPIRSNFLSSRSSAMESQGQNLRYSFTCSFTFVQFATVLIKPYFSSSLYFFLTFSLFLSNFLSISFSLSISFLLSLYFFLTFSPSRLCRNGKRLSTTHGDNLLILCRTSFSPSPKLSLNETTRQDIFTYILSGYRMKKRKISQVKYGRLSGREGNGKSEREVREVEE